MRAAIVARRTVDWGLLPSSAVVAICLCSLRDASADRSTLPDPPARRGPPVVGPSRLPPSSDLDGLHVWLGPVGAAGRLDASWDSTFGADLSVLRVREEARLGAIGASAGAGLWTERGGGRVWLDGLAGTRLGGRMVGASIGPLLELSRTAHPRLGGSIGLWAFLGPTPYARAGIVDELGPFVEIGLHLALPVLRR